MIVQLDRPRGSRCYVLSTLVLIFRYMSRSIMISSILSSDQLNFIERLESVNRVFLKENALDVIILFIHLRALAVFLKAKLSW